MQCQISEYLSDWTATSPFPFNLIRDRQLLHIGSLSTYREPADQGSLLVTDCWFGRISAHAPSMDSCQK